MADWRRVNFSKEELPLEVVEQLHADTLTALRHYFLHGGPTDPERFVGCSPSEIREQLEMSLDEHDRTLSMTLLATIEAAFRIDYLQRCYTRRRDNLSRALRALHRAKGPRVSLEDEILEAWLQHTSGINVVITELRAAFRYRHWLAHGRYWVPKLGKNYDFHGLRLLADTVLNSFPFVA